VLDPALDGNGRCKDSSGPAAVIRGVRIDDHSFYLSVAFGSAAPSDAQVAAADAVLRTLTVR